MAKQKTRSEKTDREPDGQKDRGAPGGARRNPARRKQKAERTGEPAFFFLAVEGVLQAGAASGEQGSVWFDVLRRELSEHFPFAREIGGTRGAFDEMCGEAGFFGGIEFAASCRERAQRLPGFAGSGCFALAAAEFSIFVHLLVSE